MGWRDRSDDEYCDADLYQVLYRDNGAVNFDRAGNGGRLTGSAVYFIVRRLGTKAGLTVRPHGLRHLAITSALDLTKGDVRAVQKISRHKDVRVLNTYDDNRQDLAGDVARLVAGV